MHKKLQLHLKKAGNFGGVCSSADWDIPHFNVIETLRFYKVLTLCTLLTHHIMASCNKGRHNGDVEQVIHHQDWSSWRAVWRILWEGIESTLYCWSPDLSHLYNSSTSLLSTFNEFQIFTRLFNCLPGDFVPSFHLVACRLLDPFNSIKSELMS